MSTVDVALRREEEVEGRLPLVVVLHEWLITVDHKRIGIMYVLLGLVFFVVAGLEASMMRWQLAVPDNTVVGPDTFNRLFTMHGTTMVFFVGMPMMFGVANYLVPLMIGARDVAFPRLNAFSFWLSCFGGLLLYFSFIGGPGLYGAGSAPAVGWFAYAPLTQRPFTPGTSTDYWVLALLVSGFGSVAGAINLVTTIFTMRCPGMTPRQDATVRVAGADGHGRDPVRAARADGGPDHAALRSVPGRALLRHPGRRVGRPLAALLLVLRASGGLHPRPARVRHRLRDHPRLLAQGHVRLPDDGGGHPGHRLHRRQRVGAPYVLGRSGRPREHAVRRHHHGHRRAHRHQDLQLAGHHVGRPDRVRHAHALLGRPSSSSSWWRA